MHAIAKKFINAGIGIALGAATAVQAASFTFEATGTNPNENNDGNANVVLQNTLAARAVFETETVSSVTYLKITLTNTSQYDVMVPTDVLTGVFFSLAAGHGSLTAYSALLPTGSSVLFMNPALGAGSDVGGEWAYGTVNVTRNPIDNTLTPPAAVEQHPTSLISSTGLGLLGDPNFSPPNNTSLSPPNALDGLQFGIVSAVDNPLTGNSQVTGGPDWDATAGACQTTGTVHGPHGSTTTTTTPSTNCEPLIKNSVVFRLTGLENVAGLTDADFGALFSDISFQYGTALTEPNITSSSGGTPSSGEVPEPGSLSLTGGAFLLGSLAIARRRRRAQMACSPA